MRHRSLLCIAIFALLLAPHAATQAELRLPPEVAPEAGPEVAADLVRIPTAVDFSGDWLLTLPAGFQYKVEFSATEDGRLRLKEAHNLAGIYQLRGDRLFMSEPVRERHSVFTWQILNANTLLLIDETGASGARYSGATLGRQFDASAELPSRVPADFSTVSGSRDEFWAKADPSCFAALGSEVTLELTGIARNDPELGPYLDGDDFLVLIRGFKTWPDGLDGQRLTGSGTFSITHRVDPAGESRPLAVFHLRSYQLSGGEVQRIDRSASPAGQVED